MIDAGLLARCAVLLLGLPLVVGCGTAKSIKEKLTPKASVMGVSIVSATPEHVLLKVDVKTDDVDLMLGMVKLKYKFTIPTTSMDCQNDNVALSELREIKDSGFAFLVKIPLVQPKDDGSRLQYMIQGAIVFKIITKIADVPFSYQGELSFKP